MHSYVLFLLVSHYIVGSVAQNNITIDDSDNAIVYTNSGWNISTFETFSYNGTHHFTNNDSAFATFTFTGTAVYFVSPLWPLAVVTQLQLDSQPPISLNLSDPSPRSPNPESIATVSFGVIWGSGSLPNTTHTVLLSKVPNVDSWAVVDGLIYTVSDPPPTTSAPSSKHVVPIIVGAVLGSLVLFFMLAAGVWFFRRGRKRPLPPDWTIAGDSPKKTSPPPGPLSLPQVQSTQLDASQTGSTPQMSIINASTKTNAQPYEYHNQPMRNFDPYAASVHAPATTRLPPTRHSSLQSSVNYALITLPTATERSTLGTLSSNKTSLHASSASLSTDMSHYAPPRPIGNATRLSYASDMSAGASVAAAYQHQHPFPGVGASHLRHPGSSSSISDVGPKLGKLEREKGSMVAVNRDEDESEGLGPPAYTIS